MFKLLSVPVILLSLVGCSTLETALGLTTEQQVKLNAGITTACKVDASVPTAAAVFVTIVPSSANIITAEQATIHPAVVAACNAVNTTVK